MYINYNGKNQNVTKHKGKIGYSYNYDYQLMYEKTIK